MDYTKLFYWLTVADNARLFFLTMVVIFTAIATIATITYVIFTLEEDDDASKSRKWMWWSYPFMIFFWLFFIGTPSKKDALLIVAGGQTLNYLASDSSAQQIPKELTNFVLVELQSMAKEAEIELGVMTQKDKIIESAKQMTTEQLLQRMQVDTTFTKILLNK